MEEYTLRDYRASHLLTRLMYSSLQGWYAAENVLNKTGHPDADPEKFQKPVKLIETVQGWSESLHPGDTPYLKSDGTVTMTGESAGQAARILIGVIESIMDNQIRETAVEIDKYLRLLGK